MTKNKTVQDASIDELEKIGFKLYQERTQLSQTLNEINSQLQQIISEVAKREADKPAPNGEDAKPKENKK